MYMSNFFLTALLKHGMHQTKHNLSAIMYIQRVIQTFNLILEIYKIVLLLVLFFDCG
jgi:hypothetical protein